MKRWKTMLAGAAVAVGGLSGCKQPLYMSKTDHEEIRGMGLPLNLEGDPSQSLSAPTGDGHKPPPTVLDPDRPARYLTLPEAFAIALEQGTEGGAPQGAIVSGRVNENLPAGLGSAIRDDNVRVFALDPALVGSAIEASLAKFDARWISSMTWQKQDNAVSNTLANFNNGDIAQFQSGVYKPLPTGGLVGITSQIDYTRLSSPPTGFQVVNPAYRPQVNLQFEQPLLQGFGVDINQLLPSHPGSLQTPNLTQGTLNRTEGILITRLRYDQSRFDYQRQLNNMLVNVERAYWNLYAAYFALYASEQGMRQAYVTYQLTRTLEEAGTKARQEVAQVRAQFEDFRSRRISALGQVLEAERNLRGLLSLPVEDNTRLLPADAPTVAPYTPEWASSVTEMLANRPELQIARQELKARQLDVILQKNFTRPDLRFLASYNVNGIGTSLDGSEPDNAMGNLADNRFNSWTAGLRYSVPIGYREAHSAVRVARLNLARQYVTLKSFELEGERTLQATYQQLFETYEVIRAQQNRRVALSQQLSGLAERVKLGKDPVLVLLDAQRNYADALAAEHRAISDYNSAIAAFQYTKGTLLNYNNVSIAEGPLPPLTLARAVDHFEKRTQGIVARERATVPTGDTPPPLPSLFQNAPPIPDAPPEWRNPPSGTPFDPLRNFNPKLAEPSVLPPPTNPIISSNVPLLPTTPTAPAAPATPAAPAAANPPGSPYFPAGRSSGTGVPGALPVTGAPLPRE